MRLPKLLIAVIFLTGCSTGYDVEEDGVYYKSWNEGSGSHKRLIDADPKTFKVLKYDSYGKDKYTVFYEGQLIKDADAATFETLDDFHAKDKYTGYRGNSRVRSSNGPTFKVIDSWYSTDGKDIF